MTALLLSGALGAIIATVVGVVFTRVVDAKNRRVRLAHEIAEWFTTVETAANTATNALETVQRIQREEKAPIKVEVAYPLMVSSLSEMNRLRQAVSTGIMSRVMVEYHYDQLRSTQATSRMVGAFYKLRKAVNDILEQKLVIEVVSTSEVKEALQKLRLGDAQPVFAVFRENATLHRVIKDWWDAYPGYHTRSWRTKLWRSTKHLVRSPLRPIRQMSASVRRVKNSVATAWTSVRSARKTFLKELTLIGGFFVLTVTISNLAYQLFGFTLVPVVKVSFDAFHQWCQWILHTLVFSWVTALLGWLWYGGVWIASWVLPVIPWRLEIPVPGIVTDFALVSLALTRVFLSADLIVPRPVRAKAEGQMTPDLWADIDRAEGRVWGPIHRFLHRTNARIWDYVDAAQQLITKPFQRYRVFGKVVRGALISFAGTVLFWGYIRLAGYTINVLMAGHLASPIMTVRKRLFKFFWLNLCGATLATAVFIVLNAWLAEWLEPGVPNGP